MNVFFRHNLTYSCWKRLYSKFTCEKQLVENAFESLTKHAIGSPQKACDSFCRNYYSLQLKEREKVLTLLSSAYATNRSLLEQNLRTLEFDVIA